MIPKTESNNMSMSGETFEKMLRITEKLFDNGIYGRASFRLSGGEPFLVFSNYKDIVAKYYEKHKGKMSFGILSNLTILTDEMIEWMLKNHIGIQVSLDDLHNSKPLNNGKSSSETTIRNIARLYKAKVGFSINTVLDTDRTKSLKELAEYICSFKNITWGLNASYTQNDDSKTDTIISIFKETFTELHKNNFNIRNKLRFYNMVLGQKGHNCHAGVSIFALGTNLEVFSCQSLIDKPPLGYFDENIRQLLETAEANRYFYNRTLLPQCTDCNILEYCRGGCRSAHHDKKAVEVTCRIKQELINFILNGTKTSRTNCHHNHELDMMFDTYITEQLKKQASEVQPMFVETPPLPKD
jgi:radical SAM protein with 4Fe4S-binding SPASM domain